MLKYLYQKFFPPVIPTEDLVPEFLAPYVTLYGSRLWGGFTAKSDVDLYIRATDITLIRSLLDEQNIAYRAPTDYYGDVTSVKFHLNGLQYDITFNPDKYYSNHIKSIEIMTAYSKTTTKVKNSDYRKTYFEFITNRVTYEVYKIPTDLEEFLKSNYPELYI